jgi:hypothetical protein
LWHCRDHFLHQRFQSQRDDCSRIAGQKAGARALSTLICKDIPGAGIARCPEAEKSGLRNTSIGLDSIWWTRLHNLHRQFRAAEPAIEELIAKMILFASVLSGNRNFEGEYQSVKPLPDRPPLVVAFALAGRVDIDLTREPLGKILKDGCLFAGYLARSGRNQTFYEFGF